MFPPAIGTAFRHFDLVLGAFAFVIQLFFLVDLLIRVILLIIVPLVIKHIVLIVHAPKVVIKSAIIELLRILISRKLLLLIILNAFSRR